MKKKIAILITLIVLVVSCEKNEESININSQESELSILTPVGIESLPQISNEESFENWKELKIKNGNSYIYQTSFNSMEGNFGRTTELKVENGIVTKRIFEAYKYTHKYDGDDFIEFITEVTDSYIESESEVGSHEYGALPRTIDELYNTCDSEYLKANINENSIYFYSGINGLMLSCGFRPNNCADDCDIEVSIDGFDWLEENKMY